MKVSDLFWVVSMILLLIAFFEDNIDQAATAFLWSILCFVFSIVVWLTLERGVKIDRSILGRLCLLFSGGILAFLIPIIDGAIIVDSWTFWCWSFYCVVLGVLGAILYVGEEW